MSAPLVVSIPHRLGREEAVRRLKTGLGRAAASIPVMQVEEERWNGDSMNFRIRALGQIASGQVDVADDHVKVQVVLPWLLQRFAEMAQATIRKRGQLLLGKDAGRASVKRGLRCRTGFAAPAARAGMTEAGKPRSACASGRSLPAKPGTL